MAFVTSSAALGGALIGGSLLGAGAQIYGADKAAGAQKDAANKASDTEMAMYKQNRDDQAPWRDAGVKSLAELQYQMGLGERTPGEHSGDYGSLNRDFTLADFNNDPGYQFRMDEGQKALEHSAAARGGLLSGATLKAIAKYSQNVASDEYGNAHNRYNNDITNRYNRLSTLSGVGQTATNQIGAAGQNTANQVSNNQLSVGNANAAKWTAGANAINNGLNNLSSYAIYKGM